MESSLQDPQSESNRIREGTWSEFENKHIYKLDNKLYQTHLLEQYTIYVKMADRISNRRNIANGFFLSLHTSLLTILGVFLKEDLISTSLGVLVVLFLVFSFLCLIWWWLIRSYKNLNTAKYKVIGFMEERLPASPYNRAEWVALGEGKSLKKYLPLTLIEQWVPVVFLFFYLLMLLSLNG
ncbi:MAG: hypothetical protein AAF388_04410 [Bacteroidota bacterium]